MLDTGVITRLRVEEAAPVSPEVDRLMDLATKEDQRQANERFEKVIAYLNGVTIISGGKPTLRIRQEERMLY